MLSNKSIMNIILHKHSFLQCANYPIDKNNNSIKSLINILSFQVICYNYVSILTKDIILKAASTVNRSRKAYVTHWKLLPQMAGIFHLFLFHRTSCARAVTNGTPLQIICLSTTIFVLISQQFLQIANSFLDIYFGHNTKYSLYQSFIVKTIMLSY